MSDQAIKNDAPSQVTNDPLAPPHIVLREVAAKLDAARFEARQCRAATLEARTNFARCLSAWNASGPAPITQAALMKQHITRTSGSVRSVMRRAKASIIPELAAQPRRWREEMPEMVAGPVTDVVPIPARKP